MNDLFPEHNYVPSGFGDVSQLGDAPIVGKRKKKAKSKANNRLRDLADDEFEDDLALEKEKDVRKLIAALMEDIKKFCLVYCHDHLRELVHYIENENDRYATEEAMELFANIPKKIRKHKNSRTPKEAKKYKKYMEEHWLKRTGDGYKHISVFVRDVKETSYLALYNACNTLETFDNKQYIAMWVNSIYFPYLAPDAVTGFNEQGLGSSGRGAEDHVLRLRRVYEHYRGTYW